MEEVKKRNDTGTKFVRKQLFDSILTKVTKEMRLENAINFTYQGIQKRIAKNSLIVKSYGTSSPLIEVENSFIDIFTALADIGHPCSVEEGKYLIQSMINGTIHQKRYADFKRNMLMKRTNITIDETLLGQIGSSYYYGFLARNRRKIRSNRGRRFELNRAKWTSFRNFHHMYHDVESLMVEANVATSLDSPMFMDEYGNEVNENLSYGCKVQTRLDLPECCIVMDEVGGDINMINDSYVGNMKFLSRPGQVPKINATKKSKKFTLLGLTSLSGKPILCVLIFQGVERNVYLESGIDTMHEKINDFIDADDEGKNDLFLNNSGPGKLFPGGPICVFKGKPYIR